MVRWAFALLALVLERRDAFPESGDPITEEPPLERPATKSYKVQIFDQAPCSSWSAVLTSLFEPPPSEGPWSRIILDFSASEEGTQFDRYGAFWLGGVELLRTTTAEPTPEGIVWAVEKDVTAYASLFAAPLNASLSIPNNVDSTYTGIPLVNISFTFYTASKEYPVAPAAPTVLPLSNSPGNWDALSVGGVGEGSNLSYSLRLPYNDVLGVTLDLMASPHACEEFWYTNAPDDEADKLGLCGGGVYRELQVRRRPHATNTAHYTLNI
jgi:hypothetical protein